MVVVMFIHAANYQEVRGETHSKRKGSMNLGKMLRRLCVCVSGTFTTFMFQLREDVFTSAGRFQGSFSSLCFGHEKKRAEPRICMSRNITEERFH